MLFLYETYPNFLNLDYLKDLLSAFDFRFAYPRSVRKGDFYLRFSFLDLFVNANSYALLSYCMSMYFSISVRLILASPSEVLLRLSLDRLR
jgi:hypothetical protein